MMVVNNNRVANYELGPKNISDKENCEATLVAWIFTSSIATAG
jgi:hypothetical protein